MTTFSIGNKVTFQRVYEGTFNVIEIFDVPVDQIEYNSATRSGGVGHHQWLMIDSPDHKTAISGWFFESER